MSLLKRLRSEYIYLIAAIRILGNVSPIVKNRTRTFPDTFDKLVAKYADNIALLNDRTQFTYRQLQERANQYARWARSMGIGR